MEIKDLTKGEAQLMHILWKLERAFVKEIVHELPAPKPAYSTVSTLMRILESKGVVGFEAFGKTHRYYPLISREDYKRYEAEKLLGSYFENSAQDMLSFFIQEKKLNVKDINEVLKLIDQIKD